MKLLNGITLIENASYKQQIPFYTKYIENVINPFYFTIGNFYKYTSFPNYNMSFTSYDYHRCCYNKFEPINNVWVPCHMLCRT